MANLFFIVSSFLYSLVVSLNVLDLTKIIKMSCLMFFCGLTAGSIIPLSFVYLLRPESLTNLFDLISSSLLFASNWSEGVAQRFNLSNDLFVNSDINTNQMYTCFTIEYWYNIFSWIIYLCFILSLILLVLNQRVKNFEELFHRENSDDLEYIEVNFIFYYFCIVFLAMISILMRILMEHYLLGYIKSFTIVYLLWYIISFAIVWLWNR